MKISAIRSPETKLYLLQRIFLICFRRCVEPWRKTCRTDVVQIVIKPVLYAINAQKVALKWFKNSITFWSKIAIFFKTYSA